jgi:hypothetical protein
VILLSNEPDLRSLFERALGPDDSLVVARHHEELRQALASPASTVVISVQAFDRIAAWHRVRQLYGGMVLVTLDNEEQAHGWPPDAARRFLMRPFGVKEIMATLSVHPPILREPAAARRRRLARAQNPPVIPPPALPPPPDATAEPLRRLETGESLWDTPAEPDGAEPADVGAEPADAEAESAARAPAKQPPARRDPPAPPEVAPDRPAPPEARRERPAAPAQPERAAIAPPPAEPARASTTARERARSNGTTPAPAAPPRQQPAAPPAGHLDRRRVGLLVGVLALLLATSVGGIAVGRASAPDPSGASDRPASSLATPSTAAPGAAPKVPPACDAALSAAEAALTDLMHNVHDEHFNKALQDYQRNARACRAP